MMGNLPARHGMTNHPGDRRMPPPIGVLSGTSVRSATTTDGLLTFLWRNRWIIAICVVVALSAGTVYIQIATPIYSSTAKLYLDHASVRISNSYELGAGPLTDKYLYTQAELIKSTPIVGSAVETLIAQQLRTFAGVDIPSAYLQTHIAVDVGRRDETISVTFRSPYPVEAATIVNHVVDTYMASRTEHDKKSSSEVLKILQNDMMRTAKELEARRDELAEFQKTDMPLSLGAEQGNSITQALLQLKSELTQTRIRRIDAEAFLRGVRTLAETPDALRRYVRMNGNANSYSATSTEQTPLESRAVEVELQKDILSETLTLEHSRITSLDAELEQIEDKQEKLDRDFAEAMLTAAERQYEEVKNREEEIAALYTEQQEEVKKANTEITRYQQLRSEVDRLSAYFETLDEQVREIRKIVGEDVGQLKMAILEPAIPAEKPSEPQRERAMAAALALGLSLGGAIAALKSSLDQTLHSPEEVSALLGLPVLGVVPPMGRRQKVHERGQKVLLEPDSHEAEVFRTIRTAVFFGAAKGGARTMMVTSPTAEEGKSTLASNLAIAVARAGQKTLILDADMRKPVQHLIFQMDASENRLSDVLAGKAKLDSIIRPTGVENLHLLAYGHAVSNPAEILNSPQFASLLKQLAEMYDHVIVDTPPVTVVTDAQIVGALCDVTILVLRADRSTRKTAQRAVDALVRVHARLLGVVVNKIRKTDDRYGGSYYGYSKYYGSKPPDNGKAEAKDAIIVGSRQERTTPGMISRKDAQCKA
jgi:succinoglycan biosynthesis transport protein ExoP